MNSDYNIAEIYSEMEKEIISSMKRNLSRHKREEKDIGFDFPQWQAEKLKSLRKYQKENADIVKAYTSKLPKNISDILKKELKQGALQEIERFRETLGKGYESSVIMKDSFFKINTRKINSLIKSVNNDFKKANAACLRFADDAYRQVIFKSEMFVANGVYTEKKAVEQAISEFENRGINCIEYSNGSRHNIADYADMAIRTASQRAQMIGEGEFRKKIGNHLIKITKHGGTCPLCAKWEGRVLIDDVYSGGTKEDGNYPLLSEAMAAGLYHPRCRHGAGTYYPEINDVFGDDKIAAQETNNNLPEKHMKKNYSVSGADKAMFERYKGVLKELSPETIDDFIKTKYNNSAEWEQLKYQYRTVNRYDVDGDVPVQTILDLDNAAYYTKTTGFDYSNLTGNDRREIKQLSSGGNAAAMKLDNSIYFSHSRVGTPNTLEYNSYKGNYSLVGLNKNRQFTIKNLGDGVLRQYDTEAKFLEFAVTKKHPTDKFTVTILSEKHICESCQGVVNQFKQRFPNATVNIVSGKKGYNGSEEGLKTWKHRKKVK